MYRAIMLAMLMAGCASPSADARPPDGGFDAIAFEIKSWGRPIDSWEVHADGTASHVKMVSEQGADFRTYKLEHRAFEVSAADYARLAAIGAALPQPRIGFRDCDLRATDMPYGTLRLTRGDEAESIAFDVGCQDAPYQRFVGQLRAMDELVTGWAERHSPSRIEQVGGS